MTVLRHELRIDRKLLWLWTAAIAFFVVICMFMFPEMKDEMKSVSDIFAAMGSFTAAFGMDKINFGSLTGFYAIECGNILGIGGALFAAFLAVNELAKEEKDKTAEFLLSHPVSRSRIVSEKLAAVVIEITIMNTVILISAILSIVLINEPVPWKEIFLLHSAYYLLQLELSCICFGISAFLKGNGIGIGIGLAAILYFMNLIANISDKAAFLKYITPFGYAEGSDIVSEGSINTEMLLIGLVFSAAGIAAAYVRYTKKDIS